MCYVRMLCVSAITENPLPGGLRVEECFANIGIPLDFFVFCCFNNVLHKFCGFFGSSQIGELAEGGSVALAVGLRGR